jgi:endoglucanase
MMLKKLVASLVALFLTAGVAAAQAAPAPASAPLPELRRGMNVLGYDPIWTDPAKGRFQERHFEEIRRGGFDFVRVNLHGFRHMDAEDRLSPAFFSRLDWIVSNATAVGLSVILDEHDFNACSKEVELCRKRLSAFWQQVAPRYKDAPPTVLFELLNEPHDKLDADTWNALFPEILAIVRQSNPTRRVIIGPTQWNNFTKLPTLKLPANDPNIIATFHYYDPFPFTHQGAPWVPEMLTAKGVSWGSEADRAQLAADFAKVAEWSKATGRQVLLGEFGAYDRSGTPTAMRSAYTEAVAREAERHGFAWAYWQFDSDFLAWDMERNGWVEPIHRALVPVAK